MAIHARGIDLLAVRGIAGGQCAGGRGAGDGKRKRSYSCDERLSEAMSRYGWFHWKPDRRKIQPVAGHGSGWTVLGARYETNATGSAGSPSQRRRVRATHLEGGHKGSWSRGVRLHDLRHTFASVLVSSGPSLPVIGALLGHSQPSTTSRYAHLFDDPLREATERVAAVAGAKANGASS